MTKHKAIIIDLDGTLCDVSHRVHFVKETPPNWPAFFGACADDAPNDAVVALYWMARAVDYAIIYVSGRPDSIRHDTEKWLYVHDVSGYAGLLMRADGDYRPDQIVKRELYEQHIAPHYQIVFAVDDRNSVVKMWREIGLTCFQVADGDF